MIEGLHMSKNVETVRDKCREKKLCPSCGKTAKLMCYHCGIGVVSPGVLPAIKLPVDLYV